MRTNKSAIERYTTFINEYNNQCISLSRLLREYDINHLTIGWVEAGVAIKQRERGYYKIVSNNPRKDAIRILRANQKHQLKTRSVMKKPMIIQPELSIPERMDDIVDIERTDKAKKKISILWGMIKIEQ